MKWGALSIAALVVGTIALTAAGSARNPPARAGAVPPESPPQQKVTVDAPPAMPPAAPQTRSTLTAEEQRLVAEKERARLAPAPPVPTWEEPSRPYRLAATWSLFLGTGSLAAWNLWRTRAAGRVTGTAIGPAGQAGHAPHQGLLGSSIALLLSPALLWSIARLVGLPDAGMRAPGLLSMCLLFPAGWLLAGAAARPRGSARRGFAFAAALYLAIGATVPPTIAALIGGAPVGLLLRPAEFVALALLVPVWPLYVAFLTGMFGLGPN